MEDLYKIIFVFILIVLLIRLGWHLGIVMLIASLVLGLSFGIKPLVILKASLSAFVEYTSVQLMLVLVLIMILENILRKTDTLKMMIESLKGLINDQRIIMATAPALIGLLPSAGGALFSAPMVEEVSKGIRITPERKSFINYWFRHLWEYVSPLYPGIVLAAAITNLPFNKLAMMQAPFTFITILIGIIYGFKGINPVREPAPLESKHITGPILEGTKFSNGVKGDQINASNGERNNNNRKKNLIAFTLSLAPFAIILLMVIAFKIDIALTILIVVLSLFLYFRYPFKKTIVTIREGISINILSLVAGVIVFKEMVNVSGAVESLPKVFSQMNLPLEVVFFVLPFSVGLLTGLATAYVGATYPLLMAMFAKGPVDVSLLAFAFASGYAGVLLSPMHLCLVLTKDYYKAELGKVYRLLILPTLILVGMAYLLQWLI